MLAAAVWSKGLPPPPGRNVFCERGVSDVVDEAEIEDVGGGGGIVVDEDIDVVLIEVVVDCEEVVDVVLADVRVDVLELEPELELDREVVLIELELELELALELGLELAVLLLEAELVELPVLDVREEVVVEVELDFPTVLVVVVSPPPLPPEHRNNVSWFLKACPMTVSDIAATF